MGFKNRVGFVSTLLKDRAIGGASPLVVVLNTTSRCNLRCGYCYGQYFRKNETPFTSDEITSLIHELGKMGTKSLTLAGGEPLIRDDIGDVIKKVKDIGSECGMNTNGTLIPKKIKELRDVDMVTVSIDGPKEMNDANRGKGSFEETMAGIDAALDAGIKVHTSSVVTRYSHQAIDWIVETAEKKGFQAEFNFLFNQSDGKNDSDRFMAENEALRNAATRIAEHKANGAPILFSEKVYRYVASWPDYRKRIIMGERPAFDCPQCYAGRFMLFIDADGRAYPCMQLVDIFKALDFREVGVERAWQNCRNHTCKACYFPCFNEFNYIMGLDLEVVAEQVVSTFKGH